MCKNSKASGKHSSLVRLGASSRDLLEPLVSLPYSTCCNRKQQQTLYNAENVPGPSVDNKAGLKQKRVSKALCDESLSQ